MPPKKKHHKSEAPTAFPPFRSAVLEPFLPDQYCAPRCLMVDHQYRCTFERTLDACSEAIRKKPLWWTKVNDPKIVDKWKGEFCQRTQWHEDFFLGPVVEELKWLASRVQQVEFSPATPKQQSLVSPVTGTTTTASQVEKQDSTMTMTVVPGPVRGTWISDDGVPGCLQRRLMSLITALETEQKNRPLIYEMHDGESRVVTASNHEKSSKSSGLDYHPGTNQQVIDFVHPSMYCLEYGTTRMLSNGLKITHDSLLSSALYTITALPTGSSSSSTTAGKDDDTKKSKDVESQATTKKKNTGVFGSLLTLFSAPAVNSPPNNTDENDNGADVQYGMIAQYSESIMKEWTRGKGLKRGWKTMPSFTSKSSAWLPAVVKVAEDGNSTRFESTINSLDPVQHAGLYGALAALFTRMVPLFERTLTESAVWNIELYRSDRRDWQSRSMYESRKISMFDHNAYRPPPVPGETRHADAHAAASAVEEKLLGGRISVRPTPFDIPDRDDLHLLKRNNDDNDCPAQSSSSSSTSSCHLKDEENLLAAAAPSLLRPRIVNLKGRQLHAIFKIATVEVTESNPYNGGTWHVEGMTNEAIVATALYYIDQTNITPSSLAFRQTVTEPIYDQDDTQYCEEFLGMTLDHDRRCLLTDSIGDVPTPAGRLLCFPNSHQHCVSSFRLAGTERETASSSSSSLPTPDTAVGRRTIVAVFLCDPNHFDFIASTAVVPPQQPQFVANALYRILQRSVFQKYDYNSDLIPELIVDFLIGTRQQLWERAYRLREKLMAERSAPTANQGHPGHDKGGFETEFNLCEH